MVNEIAPVADPKGLVVNEDAIVSNQNTPADVAKIASAPQSTDTPIVTHPMTEEYVKNEGCKLSDFEKPQVTLY